MLTFDIMRKPLDFDDSDMSESDRYYKNNYEEKNSFYKRKLRCEELEMNSNSIFEDSYEYVDHHKIKQNTSQTINYCNQYIDNGYDYIEEEEPINQKLVKCMRTQKNK